MSRCRARTAKGWPCTRTATVLVTVAVGKSRVSLFRCTQHAALATGPDIRRYPLEVHS